MLPSADSLSVSVALCTHNGSPYVGTQVRSILNQTAPPTQLVVSDDASADSTLAEVQAELDAFRSENTSVDLDVVVLKNAQPLGVRGNFEQAIQHCTGDLIALSDQDDLWIPERLAIIVSAFQRRPEVTLMHGDARLVDDEGKPLGGSLFEAIEFGDPEQAEVRSGKALATLLRRNVVTGATTVFRRELLGHALPFPEPWLHDEWLAITAAIFGEIDYLPGQLIDYRQHETNEIGARKPTFRDKVNRVREPRFERNRLLEARAEALVNRLAESGPEAPKQALALVRRKLRHERFRTALPTARILRFLPVVWEGLTGRYSRFGRARYDMLRDVFQPDR